MTPTYSCANSDDLAPKKQSSEADDVANLRKAIDEAPNFLTAQKLAAQLSSLLRFVAKQKRLNKQRHFVPQSAVKARRKRERDARRLQRVLA